MKVVLAGGSGHLGTILAHAFHGRADEVVVLSRAPGSGPWRTVAWDGATIGPWTSELQGADVVVGLAGWSVNCRYGPENRRRILDSRLLPTRVLGEAIAAAPRPPRVWLQASTATIYAHRFDAANDEATGVIGGLEPGAPGTWRFSIEVATSWESELDRARTPGTRKVKLRMAVVMSPYAGGAFRVLRRLARLGLGGRAGDGRQYVSWLHDEDFVRAVRWLIEHEEIEGAVNLAAPNPLPNAEFMRELRAASGAKIGLPATEWMIEIGAFLLRTESELLLKSRRVVPGILSQCDFAFAYPTWPEAARDLCRRSI